MPNKLLLQSSNADYHANKTHLSSSQLKLLISDISKFYDQYILGNRVNEQKSVFDEGSFTHTLILEPEKVGEYAVFNGLRKSGDAFQAFKAANAGKVVLSMPQVARCEKLYAAYAAMDCATNLISGGLPEHTMLGEILGVPVKSRADYINVDKGYIVDVKTTSMPSDTDIFKETIKQYNYDLSAALYAQCAHDTYGKLFDFYWLVLSKADNQCHVYKASSNTLATGSALVTSALVKYKRAMASGIWLDDVQHSEISYAGNYEIVEV